MARRRFAIRAVLRHSGIRKQDIGCIGFSGQMHGAVLLDAAHAVIRPAVIWCDQRTQKQARELEDQIGLERLIELTCNLRSPTSL